jgi:hypothetical protein
LTNDRPHVRLKRTQGPQQSFALPQYSFRVPEAGWAEVPVSIADLGGTEIDLRFRNKDEGELAVVVAPVLRFR